MSSRGWEHVTPADLASRQVARPRVQRPQAGRSGIKARQSARSKYRAVRTTVDGFVFDSRREAARYQELLLLGAAGQVRNLELQPPFELHAPDGTRIGSYRGDFRFELLVGGDWQDVVEDVKGMAGLPLYRWKVKHLRAEYGVCVTEVR